MSQDSRQPETDLPAGWVWTTLGEITQVVEKIQPRDRPDEQFTYLDISSIDNTANMITDPKVYLGKDAPSRARQVVISGDVLLSTVRPYLRNIALVTEQYDGQIASTGFSILRGMPGVSGKYLFYYCLTNEFLEQLGKHQRGVSYPAVRDQDVRDQRVPVAPTLEQHRIVAEIETQLTRVDASVAALKWVLANVRRYKAAVLKAACEGRLVPTEAELARVAGREYESGTALLERILAKRRVQWERANPGKRYVKPRGMDGSGLAELSDGWVWVSLPQIGELARGKSKHRPRNDRRLYGGPYPFVQTGEIRQANGTVTEYSQTYSDAGLAQSRLWPKGTLCITIAANIAETAILGFDACFPDSVVGFIGDAEACDVRFVEYFVRTVREDLERYAPATAQKNINLDTLHKLAIALPPRAEQHRIVAEVERRLSVAHEVEGIVVAALRRAERLRQSILKWAFEGQLVAQDPADEDATQLLLRIQAERTIHGTNQQVVHRTRHPKEKPLMKAQGQKPQTIYEILSSAGSALTPEAVFDKTGMKADQIEEFYQELRNEVGRRVRILRPNHTEVYLEVIEP